MNVRGFEDQNGQTQLYDPSCLAGIYVFNSTINNNNTVTTVDDAADIWTTIVNSSDPSKIFINVPKSNPQGIESSIGWMKNIYAREYDNYIEDSSGLVLIPSCDMFFASIYSDPQSGEFRIIELRFEAINRYSLDQPMTGQLYYRSLGSGSGGLSQDEIYIANYGTTNSSEIESAYQDGKVCFCKYNNSFYSLVDRTSATNHKFSIINGYCSYYVICNNGVWENGSSNLAANSSIPSVYNGFPLMDGDASSGSSNKFSRGDHRHPHDTTKLDAPTGGSDGQVLKKTSNGPAWLDESHDIFIATYGSTISSEIESAYQTNKVCYCLYDNRLYILQKRESSTNHKFTGIDGVNSYYIICNNDSWTNSSTVLASHSEVTNLEAQINGLVVVDNVWY